MYNNRLSTPANTQSVSQSDQAFIRLLYLVLNERDISNGNKESYRDTLTFFRNKLIFGGCPTLTSNAKDYWINRANNTIMNL